MRLGLVATHWSPDWMLQMGAQGAKVAGVEMLKAFLLHAQKVEVFEMFVPPSQQSMWIQFREGLRRSGIPIHRFILRPITDLPKALRQETFDAFHANPPPEWGNMLLLRQYSHRPFSCTCTLHGISYAFFLPFLTFSLLCGVTEADKLVCSSNAQRQALISLLDKAAQPLHSSLLTRTSLEAITEVIPLGIDANRFRPMDKKLSRRQWQLPEDGLLLLYLGRLSVATKMDFLPLFKAFREVIKVFPQTWLVLAGQEYPPNFASQLWHFADETGFRDRIIIFSSVPEASKPMLYNAADVFISLSDTLQESFGLTLLEAMACGLPVVATDWNGYRELVRDGETGFLVPTWWGQCDEPFNFIALAGAWETEHFYLAQSVAFSVETLKDTLIALLGNSDLRQEMGQNARRLVEEGFRWETVVPQYERIWEEGRKGLSSFLTHPYDFALPKFYETFHHYPSHNLNPDTVISLTPLGKALMEGQEPLLLYDELRFILDENLLSSLMEAMGEDEKTFRDLCQVLKFYQPSVSQSSLIYHLLWMAKQGFLDFKG